MLALWTSDLCSAQCGNNSHSRQVLRSNADLFIPTGHVHILNARRFPWIINSAIPSNLSSTWSREPSSCIISPTPSFYARISFLMHVFEPSIICTLLTNFRSLYFDLILLSFLPTRIYLAVITQQKSRSKASLQNSMGLTAAQVVQKKRRNRDSQRKSRRKKQDQINTFQRQVRNLLFINRLCC